MEKSMKKILKSFTLVLIGLCMISCETTKTADTKEYLKENLTQVVNEARCAKLAKGETWFHDVDVDSKKRFSPSPFYASCAFMMLEDRFGLSSVLNDEQKIQFMKALFSELPDEKDTKDVRVVVLGNYFSGTQQNNNLFFIISKILLKKGAIPGAEYAYRFCTNSILVRDKNTGKVTAFGTGETINCNTNFSFLAVPLDNGTLVLSRNLNLGKENYRSEMSFIDKGNLIDTFVKDEIAENDIEIERIYSEIVSAENAEPIAKKVIAPLNYGLYLMKQGKISEAEDLWNSIKVSELPSKTQEEKNLVASLGNVFKHDIPNYLLINKNF